MDLKEIRAKQSTDEDESDQGESINFAEISVCVVCIILLSVYRKWKFCLLCDN